MTLIFNDDFNRTVATGLGTAPDTTEWSNAFNDVASVVAAAGGNPGYASNLQNVSAVYQGLPWIHDGTITFDFWVPHNRDDGSISYRVDGQDVLVSPPNHRTFLSAQILANGDGVSYFVTTGSGIGYNVNVARDTWYRCKYNVDVADSTGHESIKVWKASLPEPSTWDRTGSVVVFTRPALSPLQIGFRFRGGSAGDSTTEARFTNLTVETDHVDTVIWDPSSPHFAPATPGPHDVPCTVKIEVGGVDVTPLVVIESALFESAANGQVGTCEFWVKDLAHAEYFVTGKEITLKLDDVVQWRGFLATISRRYAFDVDRVGDHPELTPRFLVVRGNDINILFEKRFVYNKADPTKQTPDFAQHTTDDSAVLTLGSSYLDLSGDGISTSGVTHVGDVAPDNKSFVFQPGMTWGDAMRAIAQLPGALFYIDPDKVLRYVDVDVVTAPWGVSDIPVTGGPTAAVGPYGMREATILKDGTALATDALVWGAGLGSADMHFGRYTAAPYETTHGKWQWADYRQDLYKDVSLVRRATSYVAGSGQNHRGHQDDAVGVEFVLFKRGLRVGQVVSVQILTFQFNMDLPIRQMRISFVGAQRQGDGTYKWFVHFWVKANHIIDDPWASAEFPVPLNYRKSQNCQFVPRLESCNESGWTPAFYDPFDRDWVRTSPWGDPGCGPWNTVVNHAQTTQWVHIGPGPWCIVFASNGVEEISIADGTVLPSAPQAMARSFAVNATPAGVLIANSGTNDLYGGGNSIDLGWSPSVPYFLRIKKEVGVMSVWLWKQSEVEPDHPTLVIPDQYDPGTVSGFRGRSLMGEDFSLTTLFKPGPIAVSTKPGSGWVYYTDYSTTAVPVYEHDWVSVYQPYVWKSRFWPAGTHPPNPDLPPGNTQDPIDSSCISLDVPLLPRSDGGDHSALTFNSHVLYDLHWAWNSDNGTSGTTQADGRMLVRDHYYGGFLAPQGATHVYVTLRAYVNAPQTGFFGLGDQPDPTGEGSIDLEIWDITTPYDGTATDDTVDPAHTLIGSGSVADFAKWSLPDSLIYYQDITYDRAISGGDVFQIGGKLTQSDSYFINTFGPADSTSFNSGGRRVLELKITNATIRFDWEPTGCGDVQQVAGFQQQAVNCKTGDPFCEVPKFLTTSVHTHETLHDYVTNSLIVYVDGKRKTVNVDYVQTDPTHGQFDYLAEDGDLGERISVCYQVRDHQIFPLPKADPDFNKHPGYVGSPEDYHPRQVEQLGWGTAFDGYNCTCASACDYLDAVTYGAQTSTPPEIRNRQTDFSGGIDLFDAATALATYGVTLHVHFGQPFSDFDTTLSAGPTMIQGLYSQIPRGYSSQLSFLGGHCMMALCWSDTKNAILVYDPLNTAPIWMPTQMVRNYMEAFAGGNCDFGGTI